MAGLSGYELIAKMRKTRRRHPLYPTEQALYNELVAICNEDDWQDVFSCSNEELCAALHITENTLTAARLRLIQAGLIFYKSGKSKRQFGKYSFTKELANEATTSKFEAVAATNTATNIGVNAATNAATNAEDYNKQKGKQKPNNTAAVLFSENFERVWQGWEQFRKEKKQKLTDTTKAKQREMLSVYDEQTAIAMLEQSMTNGWTGIFELKQQNRPKYENQLSALEKEKEKFRNRQQIPEDNWQ